jgi:hypothetical protein
VKPVKYILIFYAYLNLLLFISSLAHWVHMIFVFSHFLLLFGIIKYCVLNKSKKQSNQELAKWLKY